MTGVQTCALPISSAETRRYLTTVPGKEGPGEKTCRYLEEASVEPIACRLRWNLSDIDPTAEELVVDILLSAEADEAS